MRVILLTLTLLGVTVSGWACGSYEECMEHGDVYFDGYENDASIPGAKNWSIPGAEVQYLKAIAYELHAIYQELKGREEK